MILNNLRGRIVVKNCAIFLAIFSLILFILVQGSLLYFNKKAEEELLTESANAQKTIVESIQLFHLEKNPKSEFLNHSDYFCKKINIQSGLTTFIFNPQKEQLSSSDTKVIDFSQELKTINAADSNIIMFTKSDHLPVIHFLSILKYNEQTIGILGFEYSLANTVNVINQCVFFYLMTFIWAIPLIFLFSYILSKKIIVPINNMTSVVKKINDGNYNLQISYRNNDEIGELTQVINQMILNAGSHISQIDSERTRLAKVLASLDDGVLAIDRIGNVILDNQYIQTYLNVSKPKSIYDFKHQSFMRYTFDDLRNGKEHISFEIECNNRNLLIIGSPIHGEELEENYLIIIRNITAEHQIQKEQHKFISSVSHELRTPLTTIIGYTDMLTRRNIIDGDIIVRSLNTINREGHRLLRLVDDLIKVNRIEHFEFEYHKTNIDLNHLLNAVIEQMNIKAHASEIDINFKSDNDLPPIIGDYDRLSQLFINIIHNAIKYSNPGDIVDVVAAQENNNIVISVRDYGIGIDDNEQKKIFAAFYRVEEDRSRSENEGGAGLGLFLVKQIVDNHSGTLDVKSVLGEGTIFIISLPINPILVGGSTDE